ncbi:MAG: tetratricopeptide repeat protein [Candidatus Cloacimonadota bacterium]|nr:tetratricopeptide repeat protein [Candidatus Cloacimonadota bacterium]
MKKIVFLIMLAFFSTLLYLHGNNIEYKKRINSSQGLQKIKAINEFSIQLRNTNIEEAFEYAVNAFDNLQKVTEKNDKYYKLTAEVYLNLSKIYLILEDYSRSFQFINSLIISAEKTNNQKILMDARLNLAKLYKKTKEYPQAIAQLKMSIIIARNFGETYHEIEILLELGIIERLNKHFSLSEEILTKALELSSKNQYSKLIGDSNLQIARLLFNQKLFVKSELFLKNALAQYSKINNTILIAQIYNEYGWMYSQTNKKEQSVKYNKKALKLRKELNEIELSASSEINIGNVYFESSEYQQSMLHYKKAEKILLDTKFSNIQHTLSRCYLAIYRTYEKIYNLEKAVEYYHKYIDIEDLKTNMKISYIESKMNFENKTIPFIGDIKVEKKETGINFFNSTILFLFSILLIAYIYSQKVSKIKYTKINAANDIVNNNFLNLLSENKDLKEYNQHLEEEVYEKDSIINNETKIRLNTQKELNSASKKAHSFDKLVQQKTLEKINLQRKNDIETFIEESIYANKHITNELFELINSKSNDSQNLKLLYFFDNFIWILDNSNRELSKIISHTIRFLKLGSNQEIEFSYSKTVESQINTKPLYLFYVLNYILQQDKREVRSSENLPKVELIVTSVDVQKDLFDAQIIIKLNYLDVSDADIKKLNDNFYLGHNVESKLISQLSLAKSIIELSFDGNFIIEHKPKSYVFKMNFIVTSA